MSAPPSTDLLWARLLGHVAGRDAAPLQRAYGLARQAHAGQWRDGNVEPYLVHPLRVALLLAEELGSGDPVILSSALLHDVLEDSALRQEEVERLCGTEVASLVQQLTKPPATAAEKGARDAAYYAGLAGGAPGARLVKCADRVDNLRSMAALGQPQRLLRYREETRRYILPLADHPRLRALLQELCGTPERPQ